VPGAERRASPQRSRERILRAARGQDRSILRLNEVARQAGLGVGTVYRHFPTVHALVEALTLDTLHRLRAVAAEALAKPDAGTALARFLRAALDLQLEEGGLQAVLLSPADESEDAREAPTTTTAATKGRTRTGRRTPSTSPRR
jgi:AcrR family transcriptional regulator